MIILQIVLGLLGFVLTPVVILLFFIQSRHFVYYLGTTAVFLLYSFLITINYNSMIMGIIAMACLLLIQFVVYKRRWERIRNNEENPLILMNIKSKNEDFSMDLVISVSPVKLILKIPFPLIFKTKEKVEVNIKEIIKVFLENGKETSVDVDAKDATVNFTVV